MNRATTGNPLRLAMAAVVGLAPLATSRAEAPPAAQWVSRHAVAAVTVRPAAAAATPMAKAWPVEVADAATRDFFGLPLQTIERVTVVIEPPMGVTPQYSVVLSSSQPISLDGLRAELTAHTQATTLADRPMLESQQEPKPSFVLLDDKTLAVGPKLVLKRLLRGSNGEFGPLADELRGEAAELNHLHGAVLLGPVRPLLELGVAEVKKEAPPEATRYIDGLLLLDRVTATLDLTSERDSSLVVYAVDKASADTVESLLVDGAREFRAQFFANPDMAKLYDNDEPIAQAWMRYLERIADERVDEVKSLRDGDDRFVLGRLPAGQQGQPMAMLAVSGILVALLLPAVQAAREAARRTQSANNLRQIGLAFFAHHDVERRFPAHAIYDVKGRPVLSWRVAILPFLGQDALYERFRLDEPWDSPHNAALVPEMPAEFLDPTSTLAVGDGKTHYLAVVGPDAVFTGRRRGRPLMDVADGVANTLAVVQVDDTHAVDWTRPADYDVVAHTANPVGGIGRLHPELFLGGFADGSVRAIALDTAAETLRALMTVAGGEPVDAP